MYFISFYSISFCWHLWFMHVDHHVLKGRWIVAGRRERESISSKRWGVGVGIGSSPGLLRGEGEGRPGLHCMRMHYICRIIYHKSVRTLIPTTCWQEKWSTCLKNMGWPPDLCTSDYAKRVPMLFRDLRWSIDNVALATSKSHLNSNCLSLPFLGTLSIKVKGQVY